MIRKSPDTWFLNMMRGKEYMQMSEEQTIGTDVNQTEVTSLNHIHGNPHLIELLRASLDAYFQNRAIKEDKTTFGPVLLVGPSGTGKTAIAKAIHYELANLKFVETNGEMLNSSTELTHILLTADSDTTILIDEAQALCKKNQHILLTAISEHILFAPKKGSTRKQAIPLSDFVIIFCSTLEYQIQAALANRARLICRTDYYDSNTLADILGQRAYALGWEVESKEVLLEIGRRSKATPRIALQRNLQMAWNITCSNNRSLITMEDVKKAFHLLQIDEQGLDAIERNYLKELSKHKSMKLNVISSKIGLPTRTISSVLEPYLLRQELIHKDGSNRVITDKGKTHIQNCEL
jgi:Holliday junction DNA helicase RuvB